VLCPRILGEIKIPKAKLIHFTTLPQARCESGELMTCEKDPANTEDER
jgi:hypothetical protein